MLEDQVEACLSTLERLGAIDYAERPFDPSRQPQNSTSNASSGFTPKVPGPKQTASTPPPQSRVAITYHEPEPSVSPKYDPSELEEPCDLDREKRRAILELYYQLETLDHYALLGLGPTADRKSVKTAYYERVKVFHPDRYFGKDLGPFRKKLEVCFSRLTEAYEILTDTVRRTEYDGYLQSLKHAEELERSLEQSITPADLELLERRMVEAMGQLGSTPLNQPLAPLATAAPSTQPPPSNPASIPAPSGRLLTDEERKKALARKLRLSQPNLRMNLSGSIPPASIPPKEQLAEQLKRQYAQGRQTANLNQLNGLLADAETALEKGEPVQAANNLRLAQSIAPQDPRIAERLAYAQSLASTALASTYLKQGEYEEKSGRLEAAARSYERAARGFPQASTWEAAARCLLESGGDLRMAGEFAKKALSLDSERTSSHLILGQVFIAARMRSSAIAELERARSLDPNNDTVMSLLKRLERESF
jgi:curved DNA-binding protein CbpA